MIFNIDKWMAPEHCLPCDLFRYTLLSGGLITGIMYFVFAAIVFSGLKPIMRNFIEPYFAHYLGWVFIFCGLGHSFHSLKYLHQFMQIPLLIVYPCLIYYHAKLLISSFKAYSHYSKEDDFNNVISRLNK